MRIIPNEDWTKWLLDHVGLDQMGLDQMSLDQMGIGPNGFRPSGNRPFLGGTWFSPVNITINADLAHVCVFPRCGHA